MQITSIFHRIDVKKLSNVSFKKVLLRKFNQEKKSPFDIVSTCQNALFIFNTEVCKQQCKPWATHDEWSDSLVVEEGLGALGKVCVGFTFCQWQKTTIQGLKVLKVKVQAGLVGFLSGSHEASGRE